MTDNRTRSNRPGRYRRLRGGLMTDRRGLSSVVTVAGIIAVIVGLVVGPIMTIYIPNRTKEAEAQHMDDVSDSFASLRGNINKMIEMDNNRGRTNVRLELGTDLNNVLLPDSTGRLNLRPGSPEMSIYNTDNVMDVYAKSYGLLEYSSNNRQYSDQRLVYENGAVIVEQGGKSTMNLLPSLDLRKSAEGRLLLEDNRVRGNLPGYDTSNPNNLYYNFSETASDVSMTYDIYNNNNAIFETDFDLTADAMPFTPRKNDWYIEGDLDRTNLIGKWTFSESQASSYEEANGDLNTLLGTFKGGAVHSAGKFGDGILLRASLNSYITYADTAVLDISGPHTVESWIYPYTVSGSRYIISKITESQNSGYGIMLVNGELRYVLGDGTTLHSLQTSGGGILAYRWTHVAASWDGSTMRIYVNGVQAASAAYAGTLSTNSYKLVFGSNQAESGNYFDGRMDEVILTTGAKSTFEIPEGIFSVRGNTPGKGDECIAVLDYYDRWVKKIGSSEWQYRKKLTIRSSQVEAELMNFPVLVSMTDNDLRSKARGDGYDVVFTAGDAVSRLDHEIESYTGSSGELVAWVSVPELNASKDTDIYMYYGNSAQMTPTENPGGVWDTGFKGVWHLDEEQSGTGNADLYTDSTTNNNDGDDYVSATGQDGKIGGGQQFSGNGDYINVPHTDGLNIKGPMTISFWIKPTQSTSTFNRVVEKGLWGYQTSYYFGCGNGQNDLTFYLSNNEVFDTADNVLSVNAWHHAAVSYDSDGLARLILNGVEVANGSYTGAITGNTDALHISFSDSTYDFPGCIDEVRISGTARPTSWIRTEYNNQNSPGGFITRGSEENIYQIAKYNIAKPDITGNIVYTKKITIRSGQVAGDLSDFPVLVSIVDTDLASRARSDGSDIYFTASDGQTLLDFEIESYSSVSGALTAWIKVPFVSSSVDTVIYMYYGDPSVDDQSNPAGIWTNAYEAVWHFSEDPSGTAPQEIDSTGNGHHGTSYGAMTAADLVAGKINLGLDFDGTGDRINIPQDADLNTYGNVSFSGWFKLRAAHDATKPSKLLMEKHISSNYNFHIVLAGSDYSGAQKGSMVFKTNTQNSGDAYMYKWTSTTSWSANTWYHFTCVLNTYNHNQNKIFINGVDVTGGSSGSAQPAFVEYNADWNIGGGNVDSSANIASGVCYMNGSIDEVRISKALRTPAWILTEYRNQNDPGNFYTVGTEQLSYRNDSGVVVEVKALANDYTGKYANAFIVFDYQSDTDYKYAGMRVLDDKWVIGHRTSVGYVQKAFVSEVIDTNTWYDLKLYLYQNEAELYANGVLKVSYTFTQNSWGRFGLANDKAHSHFNDMKIYFNVQNGIQIYVNNRFMGNGPSTGKNGWDGPYDKFIPSSYLNDDKQNVIKFRNVYSGGKPWAVRNLKILSNPREIAISMITISGEEKVIGGSGSHIIGTELIAQELNEYELKGANVTIEITTGHYDAWWDYFSKLLNETNTNLKWDPDIDESDFVMWWTPAGEDLRTIYVTLRGIELLTCRIAVIEITVD